MRTVMKLLMLMGGGVSSFLDSFARADGAIGNGWLGTAWTIASGQALATPTGANLMVDGGVENWNSASDAVSYTETPSGTSTINRESSVVHGGSFAVRLDVDSSNSGCLFAATIAAGVGFYQVSGWVKSNIAAKQARIINGGQRDITLTTSYAQYYDTIWTASGSVGTGLQRGAAGASSSLYGDDFDSRHIALSEALNLRQLNMSNLDIGCGWTITPGTYAGVAACWDSQASPLYGLLAYHNGLTFYLAKIVNGVLTNLITSTVTYVDQAIIEIRKSSGIVSAWYNGVQIGSNQDISAETLIVSNTLGGGFSTNALNRGDNFFALPL